MCDKELQAVKAAEKGHYSLGMSVSIPLPPYVIQGQVISPKHVYIGT